MFPLGPARSPLLRQSLLPILASWPRTSASTSIARAFLAERMFAAIGEAETRDVALLGRTGNAAVLMAGLMENWYSRLESAYQKISQAFENHLAENRWHADILKKLLLAHPQAIADLKRFQDFCEASESSVTVKARPGRAGHERALAASSPNILRFSGLIRKQHKTAQCCFPPRSMRPYIILRIDATALRQKPGEGSPVSLRNSSGV